MRTTLNAQVIVNGKPHRIGSRYYASYPRCLREQARLQNQGIEDVRVEVGFPEQVRIPQN